MSNAIAAIVVLCVLATVSPASADWLKSTRWIDEERTSAVLPFDAQVERRAAELQGERFKLGPVFVTLFDLRKQPVFLITPTTPWRLDSGNKPALEVRVDYDSCDLVKVSDDPAEYKTKGRLVVKFADGAVQAVSFDLRLEVRSRRPEGAPELNAFVQWSFWRPVALADFEAIPQPHPLPPEPQE